MISIGIIDNEQVYLDKVYSILVKEFDNIRVMMYNSIYEIDYNLDFLLLSIDIPNEDVINFSKKNRNLKIIFLANYNMKVQDVFGPNIYGCILKKDLEKELVKKVAELISIVKNECYITFKMGGIDIDIKIDNIIYCQYIGNHIVSIIYGNKMINVNNVSLKKIKEMLDGV